MIASETAARRRRIRILGGLILLIGLLLSGGMIYLIVWSATTIMHTDDPGASSRFSGTAGDALVIFAIFSLVLIFGVGCCVTGIWQLVYGKRNRTLTRATVRIALALWVIAQVFRIASWL
jgi:hypothetical protein